MRKPRNLKKKYIFQKISQLSDTKQEKNLSLGSKNLKYLKLMASHFIGTQTTRLINHELVQGREMDAELG